jgi:transcriptional regulator with XRE-family HTH domain
VHSHTDTQRIRKINPYRIARVNTLRAMTLTSADRLRRARLDAGFETSELAAARAGVKASTFRSHDNGTREFFDIETALRYARAFRVDPLWLMGLDDAAVSPVYDLNAAALGQVLEALLQAYAPSKKLSPAELQALGEALKEALQEMMDDPQIGGSPDRAGFVAQAIVRARRRAGQ